MDDTTGFRISDFDYILPQALIAQTPIEPRDASRLLVLNRSNGTIEHRHFRDIGAYLRPGDLLIANQSRVLPARMLGRRAETGGAVEVLLLAERPDVGPDHWETLVRPGRRLREGSRIVFGDENGMKQAVTLCAEILQHTEAGGRIVRFWVRDAESPAAAQGHDESRHHISVRELIEQLGKRHATQLLDQFSHAYVETRFIMSLGRRRRFRISNPETHDTPSRLGVLQDFCTESHRLLHPVLISEHDA